MNRMMSIAGFGAIAVMTFLGATWFATSQGTEAAAQAVPSQTAAQAVAGATSSAEPAAQQASAPAHSSSQHQGASPAAAPAQSTETTGRVQTTDGQTEETAKPKQRRADRMRRYCPNARS